MSMLNQLMARASAGARSARHRADSGSGSEKEDPKLKEERVAYRKLVEGYIKEGNTQAATRLIDQPPEGVNPAPYAAVLGVKTKKQKEAEQIGSLLSQVVMQALGGDTQQPTQPSTYGPNTFAVEYPSAKPTEGPQPMFAQPTVPSPTAKMKRRGPRLSITSITRNADGNISFTMGDKRTDGEKYIDKLVDAKRLTPDEADAQKSTLAELQLHDLMSDVESIQSYKDDEGQLYTHVMFKNGESRVKKATGSKLQVKKEEKSDWVWDTKNNQTVYKRLSEVGDNTRYRSMDSPAAKAAISTGTTLTMQQTAPHVLSLVDEAESALKKAGELGPLKSRWRDLWAGKAGVKDPAFMELKINADLLMTLLMKMHVGARGSEYILDHFKSLMNSAKQSPENMQVAFDSIRKYANLIMKPAYGWQGAPQPPTPKQPSSTSNSPQIAPVGTKARLSDGTIVTSDGKGGWN